jgi:NAD+ synthase
VEWIEERLKLDPGAACRQIEALLAKQMQMLRRDGILVGLSGGLDSAVVAALAVRSVGAESVSLLYLPDRDSKAIHRQHATLVAEALGVELQVYELTPILELIGAYDLLPLKYAPGRSARGWMVRLGEALLLRDGETVLGARLRPEPESLVAKGNAYAVVKHRLRMALLYYHAEIGNRLVAGAANKTEALTGTFSLWGCDHCADVMPIAHLYRSQVEALAAYLGIPGEVRDKPADPDLLPGLADKGSLLGTFAQADAILWGLEHGVDVAEMAACFGQEPVDRIRALVDASAFMRQVPYGLERL